jgi:hypothetical protein
MFSRVCALEPGTRHIDPGGKLTQTGQAYAMAHVGRAVQDNDGLACTDCGSPTLYN